MSGKAPSTDASGPNGTGTGGRSGGRSGGPSAGRGRGRGPPGGRGRGPPGNNTKSALSKAYDDQQLKRQHEEAQDIKRQLERAIKEIGALNGQIQVGNDEVSRLFEDRKQWITKYENAALEKEALQSSIASLERNADIDKLGMPRLEREKAALQKENNALLKKQQDDAERIKEVMMTKDQALKQLAEAQAQALKEGEQQIKDHTAEMEKVRSSYMAEMENKRALYDEELEDTKKAEKALYQKNLEEVKEQARKEGALRNEEDIRNMQERIAEQDALLEIFELREVSNVNQFKAQAIETVAKDAAENMNTVKDAYQKYIIDSKKNNQMIIEKVKLLAAKKLYQQAEDYEYKLDTERLKRETLMEEFAKHVLDLESKKEGDMNALKNFFVGQKFRQLEGKFQEKLIQIKLGFDATVKQLRDKQAADLALALETYNKNLRSGTQDAFDKSYEKAANEYNAKCLELENRLSSSFHKALTMVKQDAISDTNVLENSVNALKNQLNDLEYVKTKMEIKKNKDYDEMKGKMLKKVTELKKMIGMYRDVMTQLKINVLKKSDPDHYSFANLAKEMKHVDMRKDQIIGRISDLDDIIENYKASSLDMKSIINSMKDETADSRSLVTMKTTKMHIADYDKNLTELEEKKEAMIKEITSLEAKSKEFETEITKETEEYGEVLDGGIMDLIVGHRKAGLEDELNKNNDIIAETKSSLEKIEESLKDYRSRKSEKQNAIKDLDYLDTMKDLRDMCTDMMNDQDSILEDYATRFKAEAMIDDTVIDNKQEEDEDFLEKVEKVLNSTKTGNVPESVSEIKKFQKSIFHCRHEITNSVQFYKDVYETIMDDEKMENFTAICKKLGSTQTGFYPSEDESIVYTTWEVANRLGEIAFENLVDEHFMKGCGTTTIYKIDLDSFGATGPIEESSIDDEDLSEKNFFHVEFNLKDTKIYNANYKTITEDPVQSSTYINAISAAELFNHNYSPATDKKKIFSLWEVGPHVREEDLHKFISTHLVFPNMGEVKISSIDLSMGAFGLPSAIF